MDISTSFISGIIFFEAAFEYSNGGNFKLLRWMQNLHSQRGTMKSRMPTDFQGMNNF
jgi:hypothetical protein